MDIQTALIQQLQGATAGSPPPTLVDTPTGTMEEDEQDEVPSLSSTKESHSVYSVKSAPGRKSRSVPRNLDQLLLRQKSEKSVYSDGYRRNRRKTQKKKIGDTGGRDTAYVALTDPEESFQSDGTKKGVVNSSPHEEGLQLTKRQHLSMRSVCSDGDRNRRRRPQKKGAPSNFSSAGSVALSLPARFSPSKSAADLGPLQTSMNSRESPLRLLNPPSSSSDDEESFYSAGGFPSDTRAEVERLVHRIMPEEDENVENMLNRFQGRETVLLQTLLTLYEQQNVISKSAPTKQSIGDASNSTPSGLVARDRLTRITLSRTDSHLSVRSNPRSLGSLLRRHSDTPRVVGSISSSQKENDGYVGAGERMANSLRSRNSSASFATPRSKGDTSVATPHSKGSAKSYNSAGADSLVVNPGSISSMLRRYWDSTGDIVEPTSNKNKASAAASHRTDPGHHGDGNNENVLAGPKSVPGSRNREAIKQGRQQTIEFALEAGDWEKVEQVGAGVSDNSVSTISTDSELLLGMDGEVELQFIDALEEDEFARGSQSSLSIDAREMLAQCVEECASQLDAVIEEDDWSAVMEIINKYTGRDKKQTQDSQNEVPGGQDGTNEATLNGNSCAHSHSIGKQEGDKDSSKKAIEENIETESRETPLSAEEAAGQEVEITASDTLDASVQRADDQGFRERSELASNGGSDHSCHSCGKSSGHKHSGHSKDTLKVNKDSKKKTPIEESVELYMKEAQQEEDEKNTITGMSFDVQPKEDLSLLSMNSAGQSKYSNPQSELIGKLKKAIKAGDWNEVQILGKSLDTGDIDGIAATRVFKTLEKDPPAGEPEPEQKAQDEEEDKNVQFAMSGSSHSEVSGRGPHKSRDGVVDEEGIETVLPVHQAPAKPSTPVFLDQAPAKPSTSNATSQECLCNCVIS